MSIAENANGIPIESVTGGIAAIDTNHAQVHMGNAFEVSYSKLLAQSGSMIITFKTPADKYVHFQAARFIHSGPLRIDFFEDTSGVGSPATLIPANKNRIDNTASGMEVKKDWTDILGGQKIIEPYFVGHAGTNSRTAIGGATGDNSEWVLKRDATYAIRLTNQDSGNGYNTAVNLFWYEEDAA